MNIRIWFWSKVSQMCKNILNIAQKELNTCNLEGTSCTNGNTKCYTLIDSSDIDKRGGVVMYSVLDVAKYILDKQGPMTTMKLQKLAYYAQAWSLAWDEVPLFHEDFQAWANGPVCYDLFNIHRGKYEVSKKLFADRDIVAFKDDEKETIDKVLEYYGDKDPQWLSNLTHSEYPWKEARRGVPAGLPSDNIISKDSMQEYYGGLCSDEEE